MKKSKSRSLKVGLFVALGIVIFSIGVYLLGTQQNLFTSTITIKSYFDNVNGLVEGNKVQYAGITVGSVSHIEIVEDTTILVEMAVDKSVQQFIKQDSRVEIKTDGLMGSKIVNIHPGSANAENIDDREFLQTQETVDLQDVIYEAQQVLEQSQQITRTLNEIVQKINTGEGDLATLLNDDKITTKLNQVGNEMLAITSEVNQIVEKVNEGEGDLGRLINDSIITSQARELLADFDTVAYRTNQTAEEIMKFSHALNEGDGLISRLVYDAQIANKIDTTLAKVNTSIDNIQGAAETIERSWIFNLFSGDKD